MYPILLTIFFIFLLTAVYAGVRGAPWVPTKSKDLERFLKLAEFKPGDKFYDLGCGDGRLVVAAAKAGAIATGFEISLFPYLLAMLRVLFASRDVRKNIKIKFRDFWKEDLSDASVIYFFLMPKIFAKLEKKLLAELKPGAKVIVYVWPFQNWTAKKIDVYPKRPKIYLYEIS